MFAAAQFWPSAKQVRYACWRGNTKHARENKHNDNKKKMLDGGKDRCISFVNLKSNSLISWVVYRRRVACVSMYSGKDRCIYWSIYDYISKKEKQHVSQIFHIYVHLKVSATSYLIDPFFYLFFFLLSNQAANWV
jgi:hypothetical protein